MTITRTHKYWLIIFIKSWQAHSCHSCWLSWVCGTINIYQPLRDNEQCPIIINHTLVSDLNFTLHSHNSNQSKTEFCPSPFITPLGHHVFSRVTCGRFPWIRWLPFMPYCGAPLRLWLNAIIILSVCFHLTFFIINWFLFLIPMFASLIFPSL